MERVGRTMAEAGRLSRRRAATHRPCRNKTRRCNVDDDENTKWNDSRKQRIHSATISVFQDTRTNASYQCKTGYSFLLGAIFY